MKPNFKLWFFIFLMLSGCQTLNNKEASINVSAIDLADGHWGIVPDTSVPEYSKFSCSESPLIVSISDDGLIYNSVNGIRIDKAKILDWGDKFIQIQYLDEKRLMDNGELQIWNMFFLNEDEFLWIREDWIVGGKVTATTEKRIRCPSAIS